MNNQEQNMRILALALLLGGLNGCLSEGFGEEADAEGSDAQTAGEASDDHTNTVSQESVAEGFVAGVSDARDDFGDEGPIDSNSRRQSLAAGMWQAILWADGAIEQDGTTFDAADIDCDFGSNTTSATRDWQARHGISDVDGSAGPITLGRADDKLLRISTDGGTFSTIVYRGRDHSFAMNRKEGAGAANHAYQSIGIDGRLRVITYGFISSCSSEIWFRQ